MTSSNKGVSAVKSGEEANPQIPRGAVLLDDGMLHVVEPDEHLVRCVDGHLVCVRPAHAGMACRVELAA